jgi:hypothetical protein
MIYDNQENIFDINLNLNLIYKNLFFVFVLTSMAMANYLGALHHHAYASCLVTGIPGREYTQGFQRRCLTTHMASALIHDLIHPRKCI